MRAVRALGYSLKGLAAAWRDEAAFRQEMVVLTLLGAATLGLGLPRLDTVLLLCLMVLVLALELLNSGLEALVDKTSPEKHPLAGKAKDCGSAAVLLAIIGLTGAWLCLAGPAAYTHLSQLWA